MGGEQIGERGMREGEDGNGRRQEGSREGEAGSAASIPPDRAAAHSLHHFFSHLKAACTCVEESF